VLILVSSIWYVASEPADDAASSSQFPISNPLHCPGPEAESWSLKPPNSDSTFPIWSVHSNSCCKCLYQKARSNSCCKCF
jgi:hypothetical protein